MNIFCQKQTGCLKAHILIFETINLDPYIALTDIYS